MGGIIGLAVVVPVLGHTTWHLYRKVIVPDLPKRKVLPLPPRVHHSAADFPSVAITGWRRRS